MKVANTVTMKISLKGQNIVIRKISSKGKLHKAFVLCKCIRITFKKKGSQIVMLNFLEVLKNKFDVTKMPSEF